MKKIWVLLLLLGCIAATVAQSQEKPIVSPEELYDALSEATDIAETALELRSRLSNDLTPAALDQKVQPGHPNIGLATVYRTLETLAKLELICELHAGGNCRSYTIAAPGHHHHLICAQCGEVVDFSGYHLTELEERLCRETGFEIEGHLLEFIGRCQNCKAK